MTKIPTLFKLMNERNITAKKLSQDLGISQGNISDWKSGKSVPSLGRLKALADYFGVSSDYLMSEEKTAEFETANTNSQPIIYDTTSTELVTAFNRLSLSGKSQVLNFVINLEKQERKL